MTSKATEVGGVVAVVEQNECINCEICANVCPEGAITMEDVAVIDAQRCSGCGLCVDECPNKAICLAIPKEAP
ncbi:MAG: ferredoxin [Candidatus Zixiibacteriota bacterium]|nr:MAG: ferredoxin [candidate division Zixibacteria bacterium]